MNGFFLASYVALWLLVVALAVAVLALYNHFGRMYLSSREGRAAQGPAVGATVSRFTAAALDGGDVAVPGGRPLLLLLASTDCPECARLTSPLQDLALRHEDELDVVILCGGPSRRVAEWARGLGRPLRVIPDRNFRRAAALGVGITPFLVGLDGDGVVRTKGLVNGADGVARAVRDLVDDVAEDGDGIRRIPLAAGAGR